MLIALAPDITWNLDDDELNLGGDYILNDRPRHAREPKYRQIKTKMRNVWNPPARRDDLLGRSPTRKAASSTNTSSNECRQQGGGE